MKYAPTPLLACIIATTALSRQAGADGAETWIDVVKDYGADPSGVTDSTYAIQSAINAACANISNRMATLYFQVGKYRCDEVPTNADNCILTIPYQDAYGSNKWALTFEGPGFVATTSGSASTSLLTDNGALLFTTLANACSFIGFANTNDLTFSGIIPKIFHLSFQTPAHNQCTVLNFYHAGNVRMDDVSITTGIGTKSISNAPLPGSTAVLLPEYDSGDEIWVEHCHICGYDTGIGFAEHATINAVNISACDKALVVTGPAGGLQYDHSAWIGHVTVQACPYVIYVSRGVTHPAALKVSDLDIEEGFSPPAWQANIADIYDPHSRLYADISFCRRGRDDAPYHSLSMSTGCAHVYTRDIGGADNKMMVGTNTFVDTAGNSGTLEIAGADYSGNSPFRFPIYIQGSQIINGARFPLAMQDSSGHLRTPFGISQSLTPDLILNLMSGNAWFVTGGNTNHIVAEVTPGGFVGNGAGLTNVDLNRPTALKQGRGVTTNYCIPGGPTLYITNGIIMKVQ